MEHARDRPEPAPMLRCRLRPHDAADVLVAFENVVIVSRLFAAEPTFRGGFEDQDRGVAVLLSISLRPVYVHRYVPA